MLINAGIAGSFLSSYAIGTVVEVAADTFGDFGIDNNGNFIPAKSTELLKQNIFPFTGGWLKNPNPFDISLPQVNGITVQTVSGSINLIEIRKKFFNPGIETMESSAFFYVALREQIPFGAIRCISNRVEPRNKKRWNTDLAIKNLNDYLNEEIIGQ